MQAITAARVDGLIADYLAAWNETRHAARSERLEHCWDPEGTYLDPTVELTGRPALAEHIAATLRKRPGSHLELVGAIDHHHSVARFLWRLVRPDGTKGRVCTDFVVVGPNGLLTQVTGFFGS